MLYTVCMRLLCLDGPYFLAAFRELGVTTLSIGASPGLDVVIDRPLSLGRLLALLNARSFIPDAVLWADTCQPPTVAGLESLPWPTMAYSIDQYLNPWHLAFSAGFDLALVAQRDYLPLFVQELPKRPVHWLPLFCNPGHDQDPGGPRDIPVSFVGTLNPSGNPARAPFLEAFKTHFPLEAASGDYRPVFGRSRIVLNQSAAGELNFRLFQAMACGATVLTEDTGNGLADLFTPGEHLLLYPRGDARAAADMARAALASPALEAIAQAGRREVLRRHTVEIRAKTILAWARRLSATAAHARRLANGPALRRRMATAYEILALDENLPLPLEHRRFYLELAAKTTSG